MSTQRQYEFSQDENVLVGSLASKMSLVGLFFVVVGVINVIVALVLVLAIFRTNVPKSWYDKLDKLSPEAKKQVEEQANNLPSNNHLWGITLNAAAVGVFYLLMGTWTRSAAGSFKQIVETQGQDISHLMKALGSLHSMYALLYTLLMITVFLLVLFLGLALFARFAG